MLSWFSLSDFYLHFKNVKHKNTRIFKRLFKGDKDFKGKIGVYVLLFIMHFLLPFSNSPVGCVILCFVFYDDQFKLNEI